ncbi:MAG: double zinc ribbon domain-containing protein [Patescibacteria group bacterium]
MSFLKTIKTFFLDLLFPIFCLGCKKEGTWLCQDCFLKIKLNKKQTCPSCGHETFFGEFCEVCAAAFKLDGIIAASSYKNELLRSAIHTFKYRFAEDLTLPLAEILASVLLENKIFLNLLDSRNTVIAPVPLHKKRYLWRGFNQAELLGREVGKKFDLPILNNFIARTKNTAPQTKLNNILERKENVLGAFSCLRPDLVTRKNVILIDDVVTTCATLEECAKVMRPGRPRQIWGLVLAKG